MSRSFYLGVILICLQVGLISSNVVHAQKLKPYIGIHGGVNFTQASVQQQYQIITLLNSEEPLTNEYGSVFRNFGNQIGFSLFLDLNESLGIGLLPQQTSYSYNYSSVLELVDSQGELYSRTETRSSQKVSYINIPLIIKYYISKGTWSPYAFGGFSYGILKSAQSEILTTSTYLVNNTINETTTGNSADQGFITSKLNLLAGIGVLYDLKQVQIGIDLSYWYGLNNIVHEGNRYSNETISGYTYDVPSDLKLNHYAINLMVLFPINKVNNKGSLDCVPFKKRK